MLDALVDYYRQRHDQERELAADARQPEVRRIHSQLADAYARKLELAPTMPPTPVMSIRQ